MRPACPACDTHRIAWNAVEAVCLRCEHRWPIEQLTLPLPDDLAVRAPTPADSPLRAIRDRSARLRWTARGAA